MSIYKRNIAVLAIGRYGCHSNIKNLFLTNLFKTISPDFFIITENLSNENHNEITSFYKNYLKNLSDISLDFLAVYEEFFYTQFGPFQNWLNDYINSSKNKNIKNNLINTINHFNQLYLIIKPSPYKPYSKENINSIINSPPIYKNYLKKILNDFSPYQGLRQWYKYYYGMKKITDYQELNNKKYDIILKIRLDQPPLKPILNNIYNGLIENRLYGQWDYNFYGSFGTMKEMGNLLNFSKENYDEIKEKKGEDVDMSMIWNCIKNFVKNQSGNRFNFYSENLFIYFLSFHKIQYELSKLGIDIDYYKDNNPKVNFIFKGDVIKIKKMKERLVKTNFYSRVIFCSHSARDFNLSDFKNYIFKNTSLRINIIFENKIIEENDIKLNEFINKNLILEII